MDKTPTHIDLHLPRGWNQCSTEQLELIAAVILRHTLRQDRYHPFSWTEVKAELFFLLTGVEVIGGNDDGSDDMTLSRHNDITTAGSDDTTTADTTFRCRLRQPQPRRWYHRLPLCGSKLFTLHSSLFTLKVWQVQSFIDQHLRWLDDPKQSLLIFPYKSLLPYRRLTLRWLTLPLPRGRELRLPCPWIALRHHAPQELLQDFTWQQYRHLQDYMDAYVRKNNALIAEQQRGREADADRLRTLSRAAYDARCQFLAVLFHCETVPHRVRRISDLQWTVILWWYHGLQGDGGVMGWLMQHYPHCFKTQTAKRRNRQKAGNPLDLYVSIIVTIQADAHLSEEQINSQTFHVILGKLESLAKQAEEMERISKKH